MMRRLLFTTVLLAFAGVATAQSHVDPGEARGEVNIVWAVPQGDFGDALDGTGLGLSAFFGGRIPNAPIVLGTELGLVNYGSNTDLALHGLFDTPAGGPAGMPLQAVSVERSDNFLLGHLVARLQPAEGPLLPYLDLLGGLRYFHTRTDIESDLVVFRNGIDHTSSSKDLALSFGFGAGIEVRMLTGRFGLDSRTSTVSVHAGARYLFGDEVEYVTGRSIQQIDRRLVNLDAETRTDLILAHFGIRVRR